MKITQSIEWIDQVDATALWNIRSLRGSYAESDRSRAFYFTTDDWHMLDPRPGIDALDPPTVIAPVQRLFQGVVGW